MIKAHQNNKRNLFSPIIFAVVLYAIAGAAKAGDIAFNGEFGAEPLRQVFILSATLGSVALLKWLIADAPLSLFHRHTATPLLRAIVSLVLYSAGAMFLLNRLLGINLVPILTTSAVLTGIVALSLQDTIKNLFTGIWINMERIVAKGDWVRVSDREGQVMEVTWRTTRLLTRENDYIYLPNRLLADGVLENYTYPTPLHVIEVDIGASYDDPPDRVRGALSEIALSTVSVLSDPAPEVWITGYGEASVRYRLRAWVDDFRKVYAVRSDIYSKIWYSFRRSGIEIPYPAMNILRKKEDRARSRGGIRGSLKAVDFLRALTDDELDRVEASARIEVFGRGEAIVTEGEAGSTCYFLSSGRAEVCSKGQNGEVLLVTTLEPGGFFGEMSLLTGEPRSATIRATEESVCIVIDSGVFHSIFREDPELSGRLSELLSKRAGELKEARARSAEPIRPSELQESILSRIKQFFKV